MFVFDGKVPDLKRKELQRRKELKLEAQANFEDAKKREDVDAMRKYAGRSVKLTRDLVDEAKKLLDALGIPWMDAPSEGEAQATALVKQGHAWAVVSQDADSLLYEAPRVIKNLGFSGKRKLPGRLAYQTIEPELVEHKKVLKELDLTIEQLRVLALLIGTDYNVGGVKGIGPKKGLKLVTEHKDDFEKVFEEAKWSEHWDIDWKEVLAVFENMPVVDPGKLEFGKVNPKAVEELLIKEHNFSPERVENSLNRVLKAQENRQTGLGDFF